VLSYFHMLCSAAYSGFQLREREFSDNLFHVSNIRDRVYKPMFAEFRGLRFAPPSC